jgi:rhodanese-related sulfurtransferase
VTERPSKTAIVFDRNKMKHSPGFLKIVNDAKTRIRQTDVNEVNEKLNRGDRFVLIDVREESEYARGHLPGAVHLSKGLIERDIEAWIPDHNTPIVLYCGGGYRSALSADNIQKMGYKDVLSMDGGWRAWTEAGLPTET